MSEIKLFECGVVKSSPIDILGVPYTVHFVLAHPDNVSHFGHISAANRMIFVLVTEDIEQTLMHELAHGFCYETTGHWYFPAEEAGIELVAKFVRWSIASTAQLITDAKVLVPLFREYYLIKVTPSPVDQYNRQTSIRPFS